MKVGDQLHVSAALLPVREPGGPQGRSGRLRKISPPPRFDSRTFQAVASHYTGYAILLHEYDKFTQSKKKTQCILCIDNSYLPEVTRTQF